MQKAKQCGLTLMDMQFMFPDMCALAPLYDRLSLPSVCFCLAYHHVNCLLRDTRGAVQLCRQLEIRRPAKVQKRQQTQRNPLEQEALHPPQQGPIGEAPQAIACSKLRYTGEAFIGMFPLPPQAQYYHTQVLCVEIIAAAVCVIVSHVLQMVRQHVCTLMSTHLTEALVKAESKL
jgi:hypothetical protein